MELNTKIYEIEEKTAKNGRRYHRVKTEDGWLSVFEKDIIEELRDYVGGMCNIAVAERGDFKNIIGIVSDSVNMPPTTESKPKPKTESMPLISKQADKGTSFYVSYAKDIFIAMLDKPEIDTITKETANEFMADAIDLVKQAKASFS
jgi:hypothetical protein